MNNLEARQLEVEKSVDKLIATENNSRNSKLSGIDANNQYIMTIRFEVSRLRKLGFIDVTEEELSTKANEKLNSSKDVEVEKSVNTLIVKNNQIFSTLTGMDALNQYTMAVNLEVNRLRKMGHVEVTTDGLKKIVNDRMLLAKRADEVVEEMARQPIFRPSSMSSWLPRSSQNDEALHSAFPHHETYLNKRRGQKCHLQNPDGNRLFPSPFLQKVNLLFGLFRL